MATYGQRPCIICGTLFDVNHAAQICCSDACRKVRRKAKNAEAKRRSRKEVKDLIISLTAEVELLKAENELLRQQVSGPVPTHVCERMRIKTTTLLPCGRRQQCWSPSKCERVPEGLTRKAAVDPAHDIYLGTSMLFPHPHPPKVPVDAYLPSTDREERP